MEDKEKILEDAKKEYSIAERIKNAESELEEAQNAGDIQKALRERNKIKQLNKELDNYEREALITLTTGKRPSEDKTLIIVGGQSGAGKSRLIRLAQNELEQNAVIVDFDELRAHHPEHEACNEQYPETTHAILHKDTEIIKNRVLKKLIKDNYNVIYEGALRNTQGFLDFAQDFRDNDYNIKMMIMSVPKLESYGSTFVRYASALLTDKTPRWVEKYAHDGSYEGVIRTVKAFKDQNLVDEIGVYIRSKEEPHKIYETQEHQFSDAIEAIEYGRETGRGKAVQDFQGKYEMVRSVLINRQPELVERLGDWEQLYEEEKKELHLEEEPGISLDDE